MRGTAPQIKRGAADSQPARLLRAQGGGQQARANPGENVLAEGPSIDPAVHDRDSSGAGRPVGPRGNWIFRASVAGTPFTLSVQSDSICGVLSTYLDWLGRDTPTRWWHDSADPAELDLALDRGACGVTTNPVLVAAAMTRAPSAWADARTSVENGRLSAEALAEARVEIAVTSAARRLLPTFERSGGQDGFVCAQVNPARAGDRHEMLAMARRFHAWAPNIAVKLPATAAGLDVLEACVAEGITVTATVSFTVAQALAIAERHRCGSVRARRDNLTPGRCFAVLMVGRLDDYLREVAQDSGQPVEEADIRQAGLAVAKRAYALYRERGYAATLLVAALRGSYHLTELGWGGPGDVDSSDVSGAVRVGRPRASGAD